MKLSACRQFVVFETLRLDRSLLESLALWGAQRGLRMQDAIQLAICAFNDCACQQSFDPRGRFDAPTHTSPQRVHQSE
jgi:hypothetical protein